MTSPSEASTNLPLMYSPVLTDSLPLYKGVLSSLENIAGILELDKCESDQMRGRRMRQPDAHSSFIRAAALPFRSQ